MFEEDFEGIPLVRFTFGGRLCRISCGGRLGRAVDATLLEAGLEFSWEARSMQKEDDFRGALCGERHTVGWVEVWCESYRMGRAAKLRKPARSYEEALGCHNRHFKFGCVCL